MPARSRSRPSATRLSDPHHSACNAAARPASSSRMRDHGRGLQRSCFLIIANALEMPLRAPHHHVVGARIAEGFPLHHVLREAGEGAFARLARPKIARAETT